MSQWGECQQDDAFRLAIFMQFPLWVVWVGLGLDDRRLDPCGVDNPLDHVRGVPPEGTPLRRFTGLAGKAVARG